MIEPPLDGGAVTAPARRNVWQAMTHGRRGRCPCCGRGALYRRYLKINAACGSCGTDLETYRADDAPAYFTIAVVGHIVVPATLVREQIAAPKTGSTFPCGCL